MSEREGRVLKQEKELMHWSTKKVTTQENKATMQEDGGDKMSAVMEHPIEKIGQMDGARTSQHASRFSSPPGG